jgi:hypothetical protein
MRRIRIVLTACLLSAPVLGSLISLSGCGNEGANKDVKIGGAAVDPSVEARDKEAASTPPPPPAK